MFPFLTPLETLQFYGTLFDLAPGVRRERIAQLLEMVGLQHAARGYGGREFGERLRIDRVTRLIRSGFQRSCGQFADSGYLGRDSGRCAGGGAE